METGASGGVNESKLDITAGFFFYTNTQLFFERAEKWVNRAKLFLCQKKTLTMQWLHEWTGRVLRTVWGAPSGSTVELGIFRVHTELYPDEDYDPIMDPELVQACAASDARFISCLLEGDARAN